MTGTVLPVTNHLEAISLSAVVRGRWQRWQRDLPGEVREAAASISIWERVRGESHASLYLVAHF